MRFVFFFNFKCFTLGQGINKNVILGNWLTHFLLKLKFIKQFLKSQAISKQLSAKKAEFILSKELPNLDF